ncbi:MAG: competence/damage-inducible protein A [Pseudomonadota bacterium]|nr:competence/damage-inducible protein A [Pseudomonadota bacterium]MDO7666818.1 competence/damage-inducible protein A [Pseudomonadota bacterium]MDO7710442.1 competence/damage-inducible protein A [Pseudomonadota bacterium]
MGIGINIGALIIGDELLSGKRQDRHFNHLQSVLAKRGLELSWTIIVGDDPLQLRRFLGFSLASDDLVFSFGGIGATPDDRTRQSVADVAKVKLIRHPEAVSEIQQQYGETAYPNRILMAEIPEGSRIIPNSINRVPGFSFQDHHFMPGFPEMSWPMLEWILDTHYPNLKNTAPDDEQTIYVLNGRESDILEVMHDVLRLYPDIRLSSLPHLSDKPHIELSLRGNTAQITHAMTILKTAIDQAGISWSNQLIDNQ